MISEINRKIEVLPDIKKVFFVNGVKFEIKTSYLSLKLGEYTRHEVENKSNGKTAIVPHNKIKEHIKTN